MRFLRILPAVWPIIWWPFSSSIRNVALGKSSSTVPANSKSSSFGIPSPESGGAPPYSRPRLARRRALKTLSDPPFESVPHGAVLQKHLLTRAFRQGGIESGPVLGGFPQFGDDVQGAVMRL